MLPPQGFAPPEDNHKLKRNSLLSSPPFFTDKRNQRQANKDKKYKGLSCFLIPFLFSPTIFRSSLQTHPLQQLWAHISEANKAEVLLTQGKHRLTSLQPEDLYQYRTGVSKSRTRPSGFQVRKHICPSPYLHQFNINKVPLALAKNSS